MGLGIGEIVLILAVLALLAGGIWLGRKLCVLKGFNPGWGWLAPFLTGPFFLVVGLLKPTPGHESAKAKKWSAVAVVGGAILVLLSLYQALR
jgi:hypothetical protein